MRIIVTGGAGFIGSHIVDTLIEHGHHVAIIDDFSSGLQRNVNRKATLFRLSVLDEEAISSIVSWFNADVICHQAAQPSLRRSIEEPEYDAKVNIIGTINVLNAAIEMNCKVVFASTSAVYDPSGWTPYQEDDDLAPNLPYGIAKMASEFYIKNSGQPFTILRYGNVYGERQVPVGENQLIPRCIRHILYGDDFVINGDGLQKRDFIYVGDIARANLLAIEGKLESGIYNCATNSANTVQTVCGFIRDNINKDHMFEFGDAKHGEVKESYLATKKLNEALSGKWRATNLFEGLELTIDWWLKNKELLK